MTAIKNTIETLSKIIEGLKILEDKIRESTKYIDEKQAELAANELLLEDADWRELYEHEKGYLVALKFCLGHLIREN